MENLQREKLLTRLKSAKYATREEAVVLCTLAAEEITRLDHDCSVLYGFLLRQERLINACPCRDSYHREVCS